jgi:CheY-like chemotaxis protein
VTMPRKLLLAEDSLTIRKVFELALSRSDIAITAVDNGEDAVRLAGEIFPDLVIADLSLPGKSGLDVAAELRAMEKTGKIPVLLLSGTLVPLDEARFKASGARGVLFKPFESRELVESIERVLRESAPATESPKPPAAPAADERWDFSDVMDEVDAEIGRSAAPVSAAREAPTPGAILPGGAGTPSPFNEFDVSIDEIEGGARESAAEPPPAAPPPIVDHMETDLPEDSPPPVTDLSPAVDEMEEIEEIENLEETAPAAPEPAVAEGAVAEGAVAEHAVPEPDVAEPAVEAPPPAPHEPILAAPGAGSRQADAELREIFAGRAEEIFRTVTAEAVEKVMWEMTDRLAAEFSAKLRESVEAVAWEVIPATAEALIREEIARIRGQAGKPSP